jgi:hypothetical protein
MAHPVSPRLRIHIAEAAMAEDMALVRDGTNVCIRGSAILRLSKAKRTSKTSAVTSAYDPNFGPISGAPSY